MQKQASRLMQGLLACRRGSPGVQALFRLRDSCHTDLPCGQQHVAAISGVSAPSPTQLDRVVKIDDLLTKTPDEVVEIWLKYHSDPAGGRVGMALGAAEYSTLTERAKESPMFVLPLARPPAGYETLLVQWQPPHCLITGLEEYKRHGPAAPPHLALTSYPELLDSHGLVLVRGDIIHDKGLSVQQARSVMELARAFYVADEDYPLVRAFNHQPAAFDFAALLARVGLGAARSGVGAGAAAGPAQGG